MRRMTLGRWKALLCALSLTVGSAFAATYTYDIDDYGDGTCELTAVYGVPSGTVELPSQVDGKTVTSLGDYIFKDYREEDEDGNDLVISKLVIPDTVKWFSRETFRAEDDESVDIAHVVLPYELWKITNVEFWGDYDDIVPGWCVFNSDELKSLSFSNGGISNKDGTYCLVGDGNRMLVHKEGGDSEGGDSGREGDQNLIAYAGSGASSVIAVPDGITGITAQVFDDCPAKTISLPATFKETGNDEGFGWVEELEKIEIRGENEAYKVIGNALVDTRTKTLVQATRNTVIPNDGSVVKIARSSFRLGHVVSVVIPDSIKEIDTRTFNDMSDLESFSIGKGTTVIGGGSFVALGPVKYFTIAADNPVYEVVNGAVIRKTDNTFVSPALPWKPFPEKVQDYEGYCYDLEVPYYCTKILSNALKDDRNGLKVVLPKNVAYDDDVSYYDEGLMPWSNIEYIQIADCSSMDEVYGSATYRNLKDNLGEPNELKGYTFTDKPQCAVRTVGRVTVSGFGRYAPGTNVTLQAIYVEKGKQVVWYRYNEAREESSREKVGEGRSYTFTMPQGNVFFSAELADASAPGPTPDSGLEVVYGPFVPGVGVSVKIPGFAGYTAKGLPSGLKFNKKTGEILGVAKKPTAAEGAVVTFTKKGAAAQTTRIIVGAVPTVSVTPAGDAEGCKISGAKAYLAGKKVTLKVKAPKGTAFRGWTRNGEPWPNAAESRNAKLSFQMPAENLALVASFEKEKISIACPGLAEKTFRVGVAGGKDGIPLEITTQSGIKSVKASKLPSGMKLVKDKVTGTWSIVGSPKKPGIYNVVLKVTAKSGATETITIPVEVEALPAWAQGTFAGVGNCRDGEGNDVYATVKIDAKGKVSGKVVIDTDDDERNLTATFKAPSLTGYDEEEGRYYVDTEVFGRSRRLYISPGDYCLDGSQKIGRVLLEDDTFAFCLWQNIWKVKGFADKPVFAANKTAVSKTLEIHGDPATTGTSTLTLTIQPNGKVSALLVDEGIDNGERFRDVIAAKGELIVKHHFADSYTDHYVTKVPLTGKGWVMTARVGLPVSADGKIYAEDCAIIYVTDFADWE